MSTLPFGSDPDKMAGLINSDGCSPSQTKAVRFQQLPITCDSNKRIFDFDAEITLTGIEILRYDPGAGTALRRRQNHSIVEMDAIFGMSLHCSPDGVTIRCNCFDGS